MPTYDYRCRTCGTRFEVRRSMRDPAGPAACPTGHAETSRVFTPVAVGAGAGASTGPSPAAVPGGGGGCCGGGCCG